MTENKFQKPTIGQLIDKIGLGPTHLRFCLTGGGVWFADGVELSLISSITVAVAHSFQVAPAARAMLVTIVYLGVFFGNLMSGPFGDRYGRRFCLLVSYLSIFTFSMLSSWAPSYASLAVIRFFVGVSFGFGQPVWNALGTEIAPTRWRILINAGSMCLFTVGEVYCFFLVYLDNPYMKNLDWRMLLRQGAMPAALFFVAALFLLHDSPYFLVNWGRKREAQEVLESMQRENFAPELEPVDFQEAAPSEALLDEEAGSDYCSIFTGDLLTTTIIMTYTCFVMNFTYYGTLYAFPNVLPGLAHTASTLTPAMELIVGALWGIPGYMLSVVFGMYYARKPVVKMYCLVVGFSALLFLFGIQTGSSLVWHIGFYAIKAFIDVGYVVVYVYLSEVYPTKLRVTGGSISIAGGRVGSMLAPLVYELITSWTGTYFPFFGIITMLCLANIPLVDLLPFEGSNAMDDSLSSTFESTESYGSIKGATLDRPLRADA